MGRIIDKLIADGLNDAHDQVDEGFDYDEGANEGEGEENDPGNDADDDHELCTVKKSGATLVQMLDFHLEQPQGNHPYNDYGKREIMISMRKILTAEMKGRRGNFDRRV